MKKYLDELSKKSNIEITNEVSIKLIKYFEMLVEKNKVMNLTAIRDEKEIIEKHFIDSLLLTKLIKDDENKIIDLGTGAGFPGMVLAIYYPEKNFTLVDSVNKKIQFLNEVIEELDIKNVRTKSERAEELILNYREFYDLALCRGVANLRIILEYMIPFIKPNKRFLPQKLNDVEIKEAQNALKLLKSEVKNIYKFNLPISSDERYIIEIEKKEKTDKKYPRKTGIPKKNPL